jgi:homoserine O-acetyltransferase/O-succinyltransferase
MFAMNLNRSLRDFILVLAFGFLTGAVHAQGYQLKPVYFRVSDFKLQSGELLKEMVVEYATLGEPKRDTGGNIINAVVNGHGWSGNYAQTVGLAKDMVGPGRPLDPDKYFIIFPTALGSPGSSSPSASGLGPKFPGYTVADMVNAQYRLVTEKFGIKKLVGVIGASMGGYGFTVDSVCARALALLR